MTLKEILDQLIGRRTPGGCEDCDAYQSMTVRHGVHFLTVHHDEWCPRLYRPRGPEKSA